MVIEFITSFLAAHPNIAIVLSIVGMFRILLKPIFVLARAVTKATPTKKDDKLLEAIEASKALRVVRFALDYLCSIKLPSKS